MQIQPECVTGDGGNSTLTNQDEAQILMRCVTEVPVQVVGWQADNSHINPAFQEPYLGGS